VTRLSAAIQTHPKRADLAAALAASAGGPVDLAVDPEPTGVPSPWRTYRHALETTPAWATHRLVVQDDVTACSGFLPAVAAAVAAQPSRLLAFFVGGRPREAARAVWEASEHGLPWAELQNHHWCPAVCLCWPVPLIEPLLAYVDAQNWPAAFRADDEIIGRFCRVSGERPLASAPSLVQHEDVVPSLIGTRAHGGADLGRVAACWIGDCDPAGIDWNAGVYAPQLPARYR
jgi:hypothetical protein